MADMEPPIDDDGADVEVSLDDPEPEVAEVSAKDDEEVAAEPEKDLVSCCVFVCCDCSILARAAAENCRVPCLEALRVRVFGAPVCH